MGITPTVMFVNHNQPNCGVYQYFTKLVYPVTESNDHYFYIQTNEEWEHDHWLQNLEPDIVVYNFYFSGATMPWLTDSKIARQKFTGLKQIGIHHEGNMDSKGFDLILHQDPSNTDPKYFNLPRPIPEYNKPYVDPKNLVIGTFGFGLGGKGFTRVVEQVIKEFQLATIRMNIPYAFFGDANGDGARWWANACRSIAASRPDIKLEITHDLLPEDQLLDWLAHNSINCFFYDHNIGRGISGTTDYALAVKKPIALTHSDQFRNLFEDDKLFIENYTLREILSFGTEHLETFHQRWNKQTMIAAFEQAFKQVMGE